MPDDRRNRVPGETDLFTVNVLDRKSRLLTEHIAVLRETVRTVRARAPFHIDAWVVLPAHRHCIWTLPPDDDDFSGRWHAVKAMVSAAMPHSEQRSAPRVRKGERGIWPRRFREHTIRDDRDDAAHKDDVHFNPVKHGFVAHPADLPYCSFRRGVARDLDPPDWTVNATELADTGERRCVCCDRLASAGCTRLSIAFAWNDSCWVADAKTR